MVVDETTISLLPPDNDANCEMCRDSFKTTSLSCGHRVCQRCYGTLEIHRDYYLLDNYECPLCQSGASLLAQSQLQPEVTVIRLDTMPRHFTRDVKKLAERTVTASKKMCCGDCGRHLPQKRIGRIARFCQQCDSLSLRPACLECCVEHHNGHRLVSAQQLEASQLALLAKLREFRRQILESSSQFDGRILQLSPSSPYTSSLVTQKNSLLRDALTSNEKAIRFVENAQLPAPSALKSIKRQQLLTLTQLTKMNSLLEKTIAARPEPHGAEGKERHARLQNISDTEPRHILQNVANALDNKNLSLLLEETTASRTHAERAAAYLRCATALADLVQKSHLSSEDVPLVADGLLNCFHQLHVLSRLSNFSRIAIWKQVQRAYGQLLTVAARSYPACHPERVDCLDDLAYLCQLYSDVCDQATVALLMIEAARARAATHQMAAPDVERTQERLQMVDDHLLELRRIQRLNALRSSRRKSFWKRLFRR